MMAENEIDELYQQHIKSLLPLERLRLIKLITDDLVEHPAEPLVKPMRNIMELRGLGKEIWAEIDPQEYVDELRKEWDHRT